MTTDEKVELAHKLAHEIEGLPGEIIYSEWSKWCAYAQRFGLRKALQFAQVIQNSPSVRPGPKQSYRAITRVLGKFRQQLEHLPPTELAEVLGYAGRWIVARRRLADEEGHRR